METGVWRRGYVLRATSAALTIAALAACSDSGVDAQPGKTTATTPALTPSPTSSIDPRAMPAVKAYESFNVAAYEAQRRPFDLDDKIPQGADFTKYSFDPFRGEYRAYILGLKNQGGEYRGTPPRLNVLVKSVHLNAKPWPTATLSDCQTDASKWRLHNAKTGAVQPRATQKVPPPYRSTVTMIFFENHWGIQKLTLDSSRTCTP